MGEFQGENQKRWPNRTQSFLSHLPKKKKLLDDSQNFWENIQWNNEAKGFSPFTSEIKLTQHLIKRWELYRQGITKHGKQRWPNVCHNGDDSLSERTQPASPPETNSTKVRETKKNKLHRYINRLSLINIKMCLMSWTMSVWQICKK